MKNSILITIIILLVACKTPKPRKPISGGNDNSFIENSIKRNKAINKMEEDFFRKLIKKDTLHQYIETANGFWYYLKENVKLVKVLPKKGDEVIINYEIRNVYNEVIYTKEELGTRGQEVGDRLYKVDSEEFITGLQEGIKMMHFGETATFLFPSNKVFGVSGFQDRINSNQPLIIEVYLKGLKVNTKNTQTNSDNK